MTNKLRPYCSCMITRNAARSLLPVLSRNMNRSRGLGVNAMRWLSNYRNCFRSKFKRYTTNGWLPWGAAVKPRRRLKNWSVNMRGSHNALLIKPIPHTDKCPWPDARAIKNLEIVRELARTATYGADAFRNCPRFLRQALETKAWQHYADDFGKVFDYADSDFDKFARAKWPKGLDVPEGAEGLKRICAAYKGEEDAEIALRIIRELTPEAKTHAEAGAMGGRGKKATHNMRGFHHESPTGVLVR